MKKRGKEYFQEHTISYSVLRKSNAFSTILQYASVVVIIFNYFILPLKTQY